jgi:gliding motility-associated-like protein
VDSRLNNDCLGLGAHIMLNVERIPIAKSLVETHCDDNQDGYNDTWNLKGINTIFNAKTSVRIFDRYGKLIKEINPIGEGWDGTYIGQQMPASDYWYSIQLEDGRSFKGHFALKR